MNTTHISSLFNNLRFYILTGSVLLSLVLVAVLRLQYPGDQLYYIRLGQWLGLFCIAYWYTAMLISPLGYAIGKQRVKTLVFARRAIGVSAAYFGVLHLGVTFFGQLNGVGGIVTLPPLYVWSLAAGTLALIILLILAATSFDAVVRRMTFPRWKLLHRTVYIGGILVLLHIWSVGTHMSYGAVRIASFIGLFVLLGLEVFRFTRALAIKYPDLRDKSSQVTVLLSGLAAVAALLWSTPAVVPSFHTLHSSNETKGDESE